MKLKTKKGYTLVEVVLSIALLALLMVPIFGMITTTFKSSKKADDRQEGSVIGQNLLEELKSNISTVTAADIPLLDGNVLKSSVTAAVPTYETDIDGYKVSVVVEKSHDLGSYKNETNTVQALREDSEYTSIVKFTTDSINNNKVEIYSDADDSHIQKTIEDSVDKLMIDTRMVNNNFVISLHGYNTSDSNFYTPICFKKISSLELISNNKVKILLDDTFKGNIPITINNSIEDIKFEVIKSPNVSGTVSVTGHGNNVGYVQVGTITGNTISSTPIEEKISIATFTVSQNIIKKETINDGVGDMYTIKVSVEKDGQAVFTSEVNKNL